MDNRYEITDSTRDFYRKRRAFVIYDGELLFLPHGSDLSHYEYCTRMGIDRETFNSLTYGYFLNNKVCFYKYNFRYDSDSIEEVVNFLDEISAHVAKSVFYIFFGNIRKNEWKLDYFYGKYLFGYIKRNKKDGA